MSELEQELEIARKQAEIERTKAQALVQHLATENQHLRQQPAVRHAQAQPAQPARRSNAVWRLAGHLVGRLGSALFGLLSCLSFIFLLLLVYAYWPEISSTLGLGELLQK